MTPDLTYEHWTAKHIRRRVMYFAYDEAGQLLSSHDTYEEAEEALCKYVNFLKKGQQDETTIQT